MSIALLFMQCRNFISHVKPLPLILENFKELREVRDDTWNKVRNGEVYLKYFSDNGDEIGYINYRNSSGQIGIFRLDEDYRNRGLGKQILAKVIEDLKKSNIKEVWAITSKNHSFWSNVFNKSFKYKDIPHKSVTGSGYSMKI